MGVAAYNRGSRVISRGLGTEREPAEHKPVPRPKDWGAKAHARAVERAGRLLRGADRYGLRRPSRDDLIDLLRDLERVGQATAEAAADEAIATF